MPAEAQRVLDFIDRVDRVVDYISAELDENRSTHVHVNALSCVICQRLRRVLYLLKRDEDV